MHTEPSATAGITVLIRRQILPDKVTEAMQALHTLLDEVRHEPFFISVQVLTDPADPARILLYEQWADEAYYKGAHMHTPHIQQYIRDTASLMAGPPEVSFWRPGQLWEQ